MCDSNYSIYDDSPDFCFLDYMSDDEIDDYYNELEAEFNEMSKLL